MVQLRHLLPEAAQFIRKVCLPPRPVCWPAAAIQRCRDSNLCEPCFHTGPFVAPRGAEPTIAPENSTAHLPVPPFSSPPTGKRLAFRPVTGWEATPPVGRPDTCPGLR